MPKTPKTPELVDDPGIMDTPESIDTPESADAPAKPRRAGSSGLFKSSRLPAFLRVRRGAPRYDPLVRTADEVKRYTVVRKILVTLLGTLVAATAITYVVATLYSKYGSLTVSINKYDAVNYCLTLSEDAQFVNQISRLNAKAAEDITNISVSDLPGDLDSINGEHNGANYLAYTFYVKNVGYDTVDYEYNMFITNVKNRVDEAIRIRIYKDGVPTDYARTRSDGGGAEPGTTEFLSSRTITRTRVDDFAPGDVHKFTVVIWLEGNDPECVDGLIDGALKSDMIISVVEANNKEGSAGTVTGSISASDVRDFVAGDWYCQNEAYEHTGSEFLSFRFDGSEIVRGNYTCDVLADTEDDFSADNIYYNGGIYRINGGLSRHGTYTVTALGEDTFRFDAAYPADAQYPDTLTESYVFILSPDNANRMVLRAVNGESAAHTFIHGDVEALRKYLREQG